jgi:hypothetical protein
MQEGWAYDVTHGPASFMLKHDQKKSSERPIYLYIYIYIYIYIFIFVYADMQVYIMTS